jgi:hypothetical protein
MTLYSSSTITNAIPKRCQPLLPRPLRQDIKHLTHRCHPPSSPPIHLFVISNLRSQPPWLSPPLTIPWKSLKLWHVPWHQQESEASRPTLEKGMHDWSIPIYKSSGTICHTLEFTERKSGTCRCLDQEGRQQEEQRQWCKEARANFVSTLSRFTHNLDKVEIINFEVEVLTLQMPFFLLFKARDRMSSRVQILREF